MRRLGSVKKSFISFVHLSFFPLVLSGLRGARPIPDSEEEPRPLRGLAQGPGGRQHQAGPGLPRMPLGLVRRVPLDDDETTTSIFPVQGLQQDASNCGQTAA